MKGGTLGTLILRMHNFSIYFMGRKVLELGDVGAQGTCPHGKRVRSFFFAEVVD